MTDPIADMLTRIRNAAAARRSAVSLPYSKVKAAIAAILAEHGFIAGFEVTGEGTRMLALTLATKPIGQLTRLSKPGRRLYARSQDIPAPLPGRGIVIVSTSGGVMTGREARKRGLGGELICQVVK